jgi:hypothetical protein
LLLFLVADALQQYKTLPLLTAQNINSRTTLLTNTISIAPQPSPYTNKVYCVQAYVLAKIEIETTRALSPTLHALMPLPEGHPCFAAYCASTQANTPEGAGTITQEAADLPSFLRATLNIVVEGHFVRLVFPLQVCTDGSTPL